MIPEPTEADQAIELWREWQWLACNGYGSVQRSVYAAVIRRCHAAEKEVERLKRSGSFRIGPVEQPAKPVLSDETNAKIGQILRDGVAQLGIADPETKI